jgi:hypothetical protein
MRLDCEFAAESDAGANCLDRCSEGRHVVRSGKEFEFSSNDVCASIARELQEGRVRVRDGAQGRTSIDDKQRLCDCFEDCERFGRQERHDTPHEGCVLRNSIIDVACRVASDIAASSLFAQPPLKPGMT